MKRIFISYRRAAGSELAQLVGTELRRRGFKIYLDISTPEPGRFWDKIQNEIRNCRAFVLVCKPRSFDRAADEVDWIDKECAEALAANRLIIPVLSADFVMKGAFPESVTEALRFGGVTLSADFPHATFDRLSDLVKAGAGGSNAPAWVSGACLAMVGIATAAWYFGKTPSKNSVPSASTPSAAAIESLVRAPDGAPPSPPSETKAQKESVKPKPIPSTPAQAPNSEKITLLRSTNRRDSALAAQCSAVVFREVPSGPTTLLTYADCRCRSSRKQTSALYSMRSTTTGSEQVLSLSAVQEQLQAQCLR